MPTGKNESVQIVFKIPGECPDTFSGSFFVKIEIFYTAFFFCYSWFRYQQANGMP